MFLSGSQHILAVCPGGRRFTSLSSLCRADSRTGLTPEILCTMAQALYECRRQARDAEDFPPVCTRVVIMTAPGNSAKVSEPGSRMRSTVSPVPLTGVAPHESTWHLCC